MAIRPKRCLVKEDPPFPSIHGADDEGEHGDSQVGYLQGEHQGLQVWDTRRYETK